MRTKSFHLLRTTFTLGLLAWLGTAHADIYVIANPDLTNAKVSQQQIADLYLGRARTIQSGEYVRLFDQTDGQAVRERFFHLIANMSLTQVNAYWARLSFTGRENPPRQEADDAKVIEAVSRNPLAIGYVSTPPAGNKVRVILHLHD